jgi:hypothetical protein
MLPKLKNYGNNSALRRNSDNNEKKGMIEFEKEHVGLKKNLHLHMGRVLA